MVEQRFPIVLRRRFMVLLTALALAGCPFAFNQDFGAEVKLVGPAGTACADGGDGEIIVFCQHFEEQDGVGWRANAIAKALGEILEGETRIDGDVGGTVQADARLYQTFVVESDTLNPGDPVPNLVLDATLFGRFLERASGGPATSSVHYKVQIWTAGCSATGCGVPTSPTTLVDLMLDSNSDRYFHPRPTVPVAGFLVGDVFGAKAELVLTSQPLGPGERVGVEANADFDFRDLDEEAVVARLAGP
jgi:hypothetical protein